MVAASLLPAHSSQCFLHKSSVFKCKKRRLLNCRKLCFRGALFDDNGGISDPNRLVAEALKSALEPYSENESDNLKVMLNLTSELKRCNIMRLSEVSVARRGANDVSSSV